MSDELHRALADPTAFLREVDSIWFGGLNPTVPGRRHLIADMRDGLARLATAMDGATLPWEDGYGEATPAKADRFVCVTLPTGEYEVERHLVIDLAQSSTYAGHPARAALAAESPSSTHATRIARALNAVEDDVYDARIPAPIEEAF